jgi:ABC transporter
VGAVIEARDLTKRYGNNVAVDHLSFTVQPGRVTGFLGPNGAGKSTTMRLLLGLDSPTAGVSTINGKRYVDLPAPLREVGALLEARAVHTGRSARDQMLAMAATHGISRRRVDELLAMVGLEDVASKRVSSRWGWASGSGSPRQPPPNESTLLLHRSRARWSVPGQVRPLQQLSPPRRSTRSVRRTASTEHAGGRTDRRRITCDCPGPFRGGSGTSGVEATNASVADRGEHGSYCRVVNARRR